MRPTSRATRSTGSNIVPFRRRLDVARRRADKTIVDPMTHFLEQEDRRRMQQNLAAAAVVIVIVVSGLWLIDHLRASARVALCVEAGHRNCLPQSH